MDAVQYAMDQQEHRLYVVQKAVELLLEDDMTLNDACKALKAMGIQKWSGGDYTKWSLWQILSACGLTVGDIKGAA